MTNYRRARRRVDSNHVAIVDALRCAGFSVQSLATLGGGVPDLLIGCNGRNVLLEVKAERGRVGEMQLAWIGNWRGAVRVARSPQEAIAIVREEVGAGNPF